MAHSRTPWRGAARRLLAAAAALALTACGADPDEVVSLHLSAGLDLDLARSQRYQLSAFAIHADGRGESVNAEWTSSSPEIATIRECSSVWIAACITVVTFDAAGVTTLTAAYGGLSRSVKITVK